MGNPHTLNPTIKAEMARAGFSQTRLADRLGMSQAALSRRLIGAVDWTVPELVAVADALGVPLSTLLPMQASA